MIAAASPQVRQRELGARLRELRTGLGMTVEDVGRELLCSATKISRIETATRRPSLRDVRDLCRLYGIGEAESARLMELARRAREQGWWNDYSDLNLDPYIGLEQEANAITCYAMYWVPALLQTEAYARDIIRASAPQMDENVLNERVLARLRRQQLLESDQRPAYSVLLDETVLLRPVGGPAVMAGQLAKISGLVRDAKATVQVIPLSVGAYGAADSNFILLEFLPPLTPVIFIEGMTGVRYTERDSELDRYREAIDYMHEDALDTSASAARIAGIQQNYMADQ